jgi:hypothetical protein
MHELNAFLRQKETKPVLQKVNMTMDVKPEEMTYKELRQEAKRKGIKTGRNPNKGELIKLLNDEHDNV